MEFTSRLRWLVLITIMFISLILVGWGLFSIANSLFKSAAGGNTVQQTSPYDVSSTLTAKLTVEGPVIAASEQRSYVIEVSAGVVSMKVYKNYGSVLLKEKSYQNNKESYSTFLSALNYLKITSKRKSTAVESNGTSRGVCPSGKRYIVELDREINRWSTSCSVKQGNLDAPMIRIRSLFKKQIPDFSKLLKGVNL